ncbi:ATP-binding protein [Neptunomonas sp.]|uniref:ATP-binding protein n=1 Tax=Neptunomonas sp. TaxID=1971898 RepID=UPI003561AD4C
MNQQSDWVNANEAYLEAMLVWLRLSLQRMISPVVEEQQTPDVSSASWFKRIKKTDNWQVKQPPSCSSHKPDDAEIKQAWHAVQACESHEPPPAMLLLSSALGLSTFDTQVLALCIAMELDTCISGLCAKAQGDPNKPYPTFALAFALFDEPDWNVLTPHAPLRYWRLLDINQPGTQPLTSAALGTDERIVNYLKGLNYLDDRLASLMDVVDLEDNDGLIVQSQQHEVDKVIEALQASYGKQKTPVVELLGHDAVSKHLVAWRISKDLGLKLFAINLKSIPEQSADFETFVRLWERESLLMPLALYIEVDSPVEAERRLLKRFLDRSNGVAFVGIEDVGVENQGQRLRVEINKPTPQEQRLLWRDLLQEQDNGHSERLAEQFSFSQDEIQRLAKKSLTHCQGSKIALNGELWQACRLAARAGMEQLARRIDTKATWDQLVLPNEQKELLQSIVGQVAYRNHVYEGWGFRAQMNRGLGINALFVGESGTGKTMAAEVIAHDLKLDLYRVDLSSVVSKYIGETEKNLRKLFDAAEDSGAILFFDEADALFGKRSEVKDSHDRYANIEINYLLQRMETYRGLAILASNMRSALDKAFVRRLRFIVDFSFPGIGQRAEIWQKVFPPQTPVEGMLDCQHLAKLSLTGGNIHNVALNAAFLAAQQGVKISMPLVLSAARIEYKKLERPAKESDFLWQQAEGVVV